MAREDPDVADEVQRILREEGIQFLFQAETLNVQGRSRDSVPDRAHPLRRAKDEGSDIFLTAGRVPNTVGSGLEETGVELDAHGYIRVNERLETTAPNVWAIGECAGSPQFTHVSIDDFRIIRDNLAGAIGRRRATSCQVRRTKPTTDPSGVGRVVTFSAVFATWSVRVGNANSTPASLTRSMICRSTTSRSLSSVA